MESVNEIRKQISKKIEFRAKSIKMFLEYYEENDIIDIYVYDLIAYIINSNENNHLKKEITEEEKQFLFDILKKTDSNKEIQLEKNKLITIINIFDNNRLPKNLFTSFKNIFNLTEMLIELDYKLNLNSLSKEIKEEIKRAIVIIEEEKQKEIKKLMYLKKVKKICLIDNKIVKHNKIKLGKVNVKGWVKLRKTKSDEVKDRKTVKK